MYVHARLIYATTTYLGTRPTRRLQSVLILTDFLSRSIENTATLRLLCKVY